MSPVPETIANSLLPELEGATTHEKWLDCSQKFPWYPLPWLMLADAGNDATVAKASLWFTDEQRLNYLLHQRPFTEDSWLNEQLANIRANKWQPTAAPALQQIEIAESSDIQPVKNEIEDHSEIKHPGEDSADDTEPVETTEESPGNEGDISPIPGLNISFKHSAGPKADSPLFEPYHAVDYFASQGIKLDPSSMPKDKFDRQLKSFTQWLKTMKRVTTETASAYADPMVEKQAVESNSDKEVITEAMAQVLEKQGRPDKAAAIYEKLLLLHPEKGALFAARIEDLKTKQ